MSATSQSSERIIGGQYRIVRELGAGGMGAIFYGVHMLTEQPVAIKMLHPSLLGDEVVRKRFLSEASVLARLEHPHIVQWKNSIEDESGLYLIMQFIEGDNVESRLKARSALSLEEAIPIAIQTLAGLSYVHSKGIVHRDLKPSNILLTEDDQVKLADFGIARLRGTNRFTKEGMTIGTFFYMAPEQILGHETDHRADIYSMGITMFEMLTGRMPFEGETEFDVCKQHLEDPLPSLRKFAGSLPKKLDDVLSKATAKKPDERFQSTDEFIAALEINFPEHAKNAASPLGGSSSLSRDEVTKLLKEYSGKKQGSGCMGFLFKLSFVTALLLGGWYGFFVLFDSDEDKLVKRTPVSQNTRETPAADRKFLTLAKDAPFAPDFQKNRGFWPTGTRFGADIQLGNGAYQVKTQPGTGQSTLCPALLKATKAPLDVQLTTQVQETDKDGRAVHGVALFFERVKGRSRGYYVAIDPAKQKFSIARLTEGTWSRLIPWTLHKGLHPKKPNTLKVSVRGSGFKLELNGEKTPLASDLQYTQGRICLFVQRGGTSIRFQKLEIKK